MEAQFYTYVASEYLNAEDDLVRTFMARLLDACGVRDIVIMSKLVCCEIRYEIAAIRKKWLNELVCVFPVAVPREPHWWEIEYCVARGVNPFKKERVVIKPLYRKYY